MSEDFASKVAEHGFQQARGGSIKLAGARYKVCIVFDVADMEGGAEIANSLRSRLPTGTLVHVTGIKENIIL